MDTVNTTQPQIRLTKDAFDWTIEIVSIGLFLLLIILPIYWYSQLPDIIPIHFNAAGEVDDSGGKLTIWALMAIGAVLFIGMYFLNKYPHIFNYPVEITEENAKRQYRTATKLMRSLNLVVVATFCYLEWEIISSAMNGAGGLGPYFLPIFLVTISGSIIFYLIRATSD